MSRIITMRRGRGRPKTVREEKDFGTPELQCKRTRGETCETLDWCLERGIISREQHWCGIHLRWLYTLRYGAPGVRAVDFNRVDGSDIAGDDVEWRIAREAEYHSAIGLITERGYVRLLMNVCIHNDRPDFLNEPKKISRGYVSFVEKLRDGLDVLVAHWRKMERNPA